MDAEQETLVFRIFLSTILYCLTSSDMLLFKCLFE